MYKVAIILSHSNLTTRMTHIEFQKFLRQYLFHEIMQRPVRVNQETPRGGGLDSFPKKQTHDNIELIVVHVPI